MIWRRLLVRSDSTIEDLHYLIQLAMGWENLHLHHFLIQGKQYGITYPGGMTFSDQASEISLASLALREKEKFLYEYDFSICPSMGTWRYWWRHQIRVESILTPDPKQLDPICTAGKGSCPPENCGGPWGFLQAKEEFFIGDVLERLAAILEKGDFDLTREEASHFRTWLSVRQNHFDRQKVNQQLRRYATGERASTLFEQGAV